MKGFRTISESYRTVLLLALAAAVAVFGLLLFTGCTTTKYVPIETVRTDTLKVTKYERATVFIHDSTIVSEKGDTMFVEKWHTKFRDRWHHDSVYIASHDTIPQPYPVTEYVERKRSKLDWFFIITGIIALIAVIVYAAIKVRRFLP